MGTTLKEALQKAGFKQSKKENDRPKVVVKETPQRPANQTRSAPKPVQTRPPARPQTRETSVPVSETYKHQEYRDFCESCERNLPDVELYKHNNAYLNADWLCVSCADRHSIIDDCRQTHQSEYARRDIFKREYGRTKRFSRN